MPTLNLSTTNAYTIQASVPTDTNLFLAVSGDEAIEVVFAPSLPASSIEGILVTEGRPLNVTMDAADNCYVRTRRPSVVTGPTLVVVY